MPMDPRLFADVVPVEKTVTLKQKDGTVIKQKVFVKAANAGVYQAFVMAQFSGDATLMKAAAGILIAECIVDANGQPEMTPEQAAQLTPGVSAQIIRFIKGHSNLGNDLTD